MKFLQILNFYPSYLDDFYAARPGLGARPYREQLEALLADGFGGAHIFAPYLARLQYDSHLVIANCAPLQQRWLEENGESGPVTPDVDLSRVLLRQVEGFRPDVVYLSDPITFDSRFIRSLSYRPPLVLGWRAASVPPQTDWSEFDLILSNFEFGLRLALQHGARDREFFMPGFPGSVARAVAQEEKRHDVVFTGQVSGEHGARRAVLDHLSKSLLREDRQFSLAYFIPGDLRQLEAGIAMRNNGGVWGMEMFRTLRRGRIALNVQIDLGRDQAGNMRLFETTGAGSFLLTDHHDNIGRYFEPGRELETYAGNGELLEKIRYYLGHPEQREEIARRGQERCLRDYCMERRAEELDRIIRRKLNCGAHLQPARERPPAPVLDEAAGRAQERFASFQKCKEEALAGYASPTAAAGGTTPAPGPAGTAQGGDAELAACFPGVSFGSMIQVLGLRNLSIGQGSCIGDNSWLNVCSRDRQIRMRIGECVLVGRQSMLSTGGALEIGDYCVFAPRVYISDADHIYSDIMQPIIQQGATLGRSVVIEENCWLGINCVVSGNLTVGRGSVIGGNSVVLTDIPPFCVAVGSPARIVKMFSTATGRWERTCSDQELARREEERRRLPVPTREEYRQILRRNAKVHRLDPVLAGRGNL